MNKSSFQPKNPRAVSIYHIDEDDMDDLIEEKVNNGKKGMTGTQALVEFLKTTSPEEFQRNVPTTERSSNIFSRIRKQKRNQPKSSSSSTTTTAAAHAPPLPTPSISTRSIPSINSTIRKNHIEIIPQKSASINSRSPSFETSSFVSRNKGTGEPILPNKKRESSLYSGSLHYSNSVNSKLFKLNDEYLSKSDGVDTIESALLQRLERMKLINHELPSNQVATGLAAEHVRALGITLSLDNDHLLNDQKNNMRHMQVQTDFNNDATMESTTNITTTTTTTTTTTATATTITTQQDIDFENRAKRAEAALENALDHFEVITGLAYKKLRELWEEKMRWENACMDLRDRLVLLEQKKFSYQQQFHNNFLVEEDELGLSEFPCSE
ncbi:hypothetical protein BD770DRAFT_463606 [Pilaira anomala]|nr:hypothetical protein BD770DRAFT_463606 [Pilaira anomala]